LCARLLCRPAHRAGLIFVLALLLGSCTQGSSGLSPHTSTEKARAGVVLAGHILYGRVQMNGLDQDAGTFIANADGTNEHPLRMPEGTCCPRISPDETRLLVFTANDR
jgi:hypothetical protein